MKKLFSVIAAIAFFVQLNADFSWSTPTTISTSSVDSSDPSIVVDVSGNATAIWVESSLVKSSTQPSGGSWGSLNTLSGTGASSPGIGIDSSGNIIAIWLEGTVVKTASLPAGGSWGSATAISDTGASNPVLAVDTSGNAVAVWVRNAFIESANFAVGGSWSGVSMLSASGASNPDVAIGSNSNIMAVWQDASSNLTFSTMLLGNGWGTPQSVISDSNIHNFPKVAVDSNGNATAVWYRYLQSGSTFLNVEVLGASYTSGNGWGPATVLSASPSYIDPSQLVARVLVDSSGNALAVWTSAAFNNTLNIESAIKPNLKNWVLGGALVLQNIYASGVNIAATPVGDAISLYMFYDGTTLEIQSSTTDIAGTGFNFWSIPLIVSQGTNNAFPDVAVSLNGTTLNGAAVWVQNDGSHNLVQASTGTKQALGPPSNPTVVQNSTDFGVFVQYSNTISWDASTDPNVIGYNLYRNGIFWNQVLASTLSVVDQNATQNGSVVYAIGSINDAQDQSVLVTVSFP